MVCDISIILYYPLSLVETVAVFLWRSIKFVLVAHEFVIVLIRTKESSSTHVLPLNILCYSVQLDAKESSSTRVALEYFVLLSTA
jgi:hypothetical protein